MGKTANGVAHSLSELGIHRVTPFRAEFRYFGCLAYRIMLLYTYTSPLFVSFFRWCVELFSFQIKCTRYQSEKKGVGCIKQVAKDMLGEFKGKNGICKLSKIREKRPASMKVH